MMPNMHNRSTVTITFACCFNEKKKQQRADKVKLGEFPHYYSTRCFAWISEPVFVSFIQDHGRAIGKYFLYFSDLRKKRNDWENCENKTKTRTKPELRLNDSQRECTVKVLVQVERTEVDGGWSKKYHNLGIALNSVFFRISIFPIIWRSRW